MHGRGLERALGAVAGKAGLMYLAALFGLRVVHRRALAQWTAIDFAAAVAVGAIVGRTAVASTQSLVTGVVALATILVAHTVVTFARYRGWVSRMTDHRVRVLPEVGTESDVLAGGLDQAADWTPRASA